MPSSWQVIRLKYVAGVELSSVDRLELHTEKKVKVCHYPEVYYNEYIDESTSVSSGTCTDREFQKFSLRFNDIVMTKDSESYNDIGVPVFIDSNLNNAVGGYHLAIVRVFAEYCQAEFLFRYIQSSPVRFYFAECANGITRFGLKKFHIENLRVLLPSVEEQKRITRFLRMNTKKIDNLKTKVRRKIELLKEQRKSLINHCVTRGLNANAQLKDSGVEWIGETPKHWRIVKLKYLAHHIIERRLPKDGEIKISSENVESHTGKVKDFYAKYESEGQVFQKGDILFNKLGVYLNKVVHCDYEGLSMSELIVLRSYGIQSQYLHKVLSSINFIKSIDSESRGVKLPRPPVEKIMNAYIAVPHFAEQRKIINHLDGRLSNIDRLVGLHQKQVELLKEYRQSLISATVTGKIKIAKDML